MYKLSRGYEIFNQKIRIGGIMKEYRVSVSLVENETKVDEITDNFVNPEIAEKMLELSKEEFDYQNKIVESIESRTTALIALSGIIIAILGSFQTSQSEFETRDVLNAGLNNMDLLLSVISVVLLGLAIVFFLVAILPKSYRRIDLDKLLDDKNHKMSYADFLCQQAENLAFYSKNNKIVLSKSLDFFQKGIFSLMISLILVILKNCILRICIM